MLVTLATILALSFVAVGTVILLTLAADTLRFGISPTPTGAAARRVICDLVAHAPHTQRVVDLGSGAGGMACVLARAVPQSQITGIEGSLQAFWLARLRAMVGRWPQSLTLLRADFMKVPLAGYGGVFCYLYPGAMARLSAKLKAELPDRAWVISYMFALPGWQPDRVVRVNKMRHPIYVYTISKGDTHKSTPGHA